MLPLPNAASSILDLRKLEEYCLSPEHPRGRHKARVFRDALGIGPSQAAWLRQQILTALSEAEAAELEPDNFGRRWRVDVAIARQNRRRGKNFVAHANGRGYSPFCDVLGAMTTKSAKNGKPSELDVVALLADRPKDGLARGQVGTVVETLDHTSALVEFSDDHGRAYAVVPCAYSDLIVLHYAPEAA
jgi:hypothetical protein